MYVYHHKVRKMIQKDKKTNERYISKTYNDRKYNKNKKEE